MNDDNPNGDLEFLSRAVELLNDLPPEHRLTGVRAMRLVAEHGRDFGGIAEYSLDYLQARAASEYHPERTI